MRSTIMACLRVLCRPGRDSMSNAPRVHERFRSSRAARGPPRLAAAAHWHRNVVPLQADRANLRVTPLHWQQAPATFVELRRTHDPKQSPLETELTPFKPNVGSIETTSPALWKPM